MKSTIIITSLIAAAFSAPTTLSTQRRQAGGNFQTFTAALGGIAATPVQDSGNADRPFQVKGDTFVNIGAALTRSCDQQFNACANAANGGDATLSVGACSAQKTDCDGSVAASTAAATGGAQAGGNANNNAAGNANNNAAGNANNNANANAGANAQQGNNAGGNGNANNNNNNGQPAACNKKHKKRSATKQ
ncbi:hypothetical protein CC86DRAFT_413786 [Ophiobolus disseminans]|uniref:Uncharacterized protein n=1 Tax=Ophiobolus disseminans TaxID=1469910 RepID=A0A6A6ZEF3_9PLEO|nr:hypothetical protein CC86DRAFT_413786 [Ophiobolus disseminans]